VQYVGEINKLKLKFEKFTLENALLKRDKNSDSLIIIQHKKGEKLDMKRC
jgi:hypothetical protein